jgi:hypothetical protein
LRRPNWKALVLEATRLDKCNYQLPMLLFQEVVNVMKMDSEELMFLGRMFDDKKGEYIAEYLQNLEIAKTFIIIAT